jgi:DNA-binding FadR family transcriptional regulator
MSESRSTAKPALGHLNADSVRPITRPDLVTVVTESVRQRIVDGEFLPGEYLASEAELAKAFGVSRNVIREAMRNLRSLGLVEVTQGQRPKVKAVDVEASINTLSTLLSRSGSTWANLTELRAPLECSIASLAAERAEQEHIDKVAQTIVDMENAKDDEHRKASDTAFHYLLAESTGNPLFVTVVNTIIRLICELEEGAFALPSAPHYTIDEHKAILEAVRSGDGKAAHRAMLQHIELATKRFQKIKAKANPHISSGF